MRYRSCIIFSAKKRPLAVTSHHRKADSASQKRRLWRHSKIKNIFFNKRCLRQACSLAAGAFSCDKVILFAAEPCCRRFSYILFLAGKPRRRRVFVKKGWFFTNSKGRTPWWTPTNAQRLYSQPVCSRIPSIPPISFNFDYFPTLLILSALKHALMHTRVFTMLNKTHKI